MTIAYPDMNIWRGRDWGSATEDDLANKELAEAFGWRSLQALMGGALSITPTALRPNQATCSPGTYYAAPVGMPGILDPYVGIDGKWYNRAGGWRPANCSCADPRRIRLPGPVGRVESVTIDGVVVPSTAYQVLDSERLVRIDGGTWPRHQDMYALPDEPNTFTVRYFQGSAPDDLDAYAAGVLANELYKLISGGDKATCRLPRKVSNVARQGVTYDLSDTGFTDGKSGIPEVDAIVSQRNPHMLRTPSIIMSIDTINHGRVTGAPYAPSMLVGSGALVPDPNNPGVYITQES